MTPQERFDIHFFWERCLRSIDQVIERFCLREIPWVSFYIHAGPLNSLIDCLWQENNSFKKKIFNLLYRIINVPIETFYGLLL